jgi:hypothetical protein
MDQARRDLAVAVVAASRPGAIVCAGFHLTHRKVQRLLDQVLGIQISIGAIIAIRCRLSAAQATEAIRLQPVAHLCETSGPFGHADGNNPSGRSGWLWVMNTPLLAMFNQGLSGSAAATIKLHRSRVLAKMQVKSLSELLSLCEGVNLHAKDPLAPQCND